MHQMSFKVMSLICIEILWSDLDEPQIELRLVNITMPPCNQV